MTELARQPADEVRSLARLAFSELGDAATGLYGFHRAFAARAFRASGPGAMPARVIHDAISERAYAGVGGAFRLVGAVADVGLGRRRVPDGRSFSDTPRGALVVGALTGLIGDRLESDGERPAPADGGAGRRAGGHAGSGAPARRVPGGHG